MKMQGGARDLIGYIRVSTKRQDEKGIGLDTQEKLIKLFCDERNLKVIEIYEDGRSAVGAHSLARRGGLQDAISQCQKRNLPLIIPSVSRFSRSASALQQLKKTPIKIIVVDQGGPISKKALRALVDSAQVQAEELSKRAKDGLKKRRAAGKTLGNMKSLPVAQRRGAISNGVRADDKVKRLADFLQRHPDWTKMKRQELADLLNASGERNVTSIRNGVRKEWTVSTLRKPLEKAKEELVFRSVMDAEDFDGIMAHAPDHSICVGGHSVLVPEFAKVAVLDDEEARAEEHYKNVPNFGRF